MTTETVHVPLGARAYDIVIGDGLLDRIDELAGPHLSRPFAVIVTDENVYAAQGARLEKSLKKAGVKFELVTLPAGEQTKSFAQLEALANTLLDLGVERDDLVIAFGGGVIGDLTGFAAAILRRGCRFLQIPTTLLAQVDSAVGGKTAINARQGKNLIGAFHQPVGVIADVATLDTLPERELRAGYAEVVKYGLIADAEFFEWLEANGAKLFSNSGAKERIHAVKRCCAIKASIVAGDEREQGDRALLNLGHTFGHALEAAFGYSEKLLHGEAVAAGMALAFDYSAQAGLCSEIDAARVKSHLQRVGLPTEMGDLPASDALNSKNLLNLMEQDKKVEKGAATLILARKIGDAFIEKNVNPKTLEEFLQKTVLL